jgi:hypothetical protein
MAPASRWFICLCSRLRGPAGFPHIRAVLTGPASTGHPALVGLKWTSCPFPPNGPPDRRYEVTQTGKPPAEHQAPSLHGLAHRLGLNIFDGIHN